MRLVANDAVNPGLRVEGFPTTRVTMPPRPSGMVIVSTPGEEAAAAEAEASPPRSAVLMRRASSVGLVARRDVVEKAVAPAPAGAGRPPPPPVRPKLAHQ